MKHYVSEETAKKITQLLIQHIESAGVAMSNPDKIKDFLKQGDRVASVLSSLNPKALPLSDATREMRTHNNHVLNLFDFLSGGHYDDEIKEFDVYYNHVLKLADIIYNTVMSRD